MALPVLKSQCYLPTNIAEGDERSCANLMVQNSTTLLKDLERIKDLVTLTRNMLTTSPISQDFAAEAGFDKQILKLLEVCIRVTVRGYDGEPGGRSETIYTSTVNSFKNLLVTCLQFLHNLTNGNDNRKLTLWLDLFYNPGDQPLGVMSAEDQGAEF